MVDFTMPRTREVFQERLKIFAEMHAEQGVKPEKMEDELMRDMIIMSRELAEDDFWFFVNEILGVKNLNREFHGGLCDFMTKEWERKLILAPRGHLKSTLCTVYYALWRIIKNPNVRILIANYKSSLAQALLYQIRNEMLRNELFGLHYKHLVPNMKEVKWNESQITVARTGNPKEATIEIAGVGTEITGRHYDVIICDDVVGPENITTKEQLDKVLQWYNQLEFLLDPGGTQVLVGTRWHFDDLYGFIQENLVPPFEVYKRGVWTPEGEPIWPEKFSKERILNLKARVEKDPKQGPAFFVSQYLNEVIDESTAVFKREHKKTFKMEDLPTELCVTMTVDPAISDKESADYTAFTVRAVDFSGNWYLLEAFAMRGMTPMDLIEKIFDMYLGWRARGFQFDAIGIEYVAYQKALQFILNEEMRKRNIYLPMVELANHRSSKEFRIKGALATRWQMGVIKVLETHDASTPEFLDQLYRFPKCSHDDLIDSFAMHDEIPVIAPSPRMRQEIELYPNAKRDRYGYPITQDDEFNHAGFFL